MYKLSSIFVWISIFLIVSACSESFNDKMKYKPMALGETNEIAIIADKEWWDAGLKDTILHYFASTYIITPRPEPLLKVRHFTPEDINSEVLKRGLRMYLIVSDLTDTASLTTKMVTKHLGVNKVNEAINNTKINSRILKDLWAQDQRVIYTFANSKQQVYDNLAQQYPSILNAVHKHDEKKLLATTFVTGKNPKIARQIDSTVQLRIDIPEGYFIAVREKDFIWVRNETTHISTNVMIKRVPYSNQEQLTESGMLAILEGLGKYVTTDRDGSYMSVDDTNFKVYLYKKNIDEKYALEMRGIWQMENDFMGGPFVSYAILDEKAQSIIFINTFIFAPGKTKRNMLQQLDCIVGTLKTY